MEKFFNTSGPIKTEHHYNIPPLHRMDWDEILHLIRSERYFVLHAPRQTFFHRDPGKTWEERIWNRRERFGKWDIAVWGC